MAHQTELFERLCNETYDLDLKLLKQLRDVIDSRISILEEEDHQDLDEDPHQAIQEESTIEEQSEPPSQNETESQNEGSPEIVLPEVLSVDYLLSSDDISKLIYVVSVLKKADEEDSSKIETIITSLRQDNFKLATELSSLLEMNILNEVKKSIIEFLKIAGEYIGEPFYVALGEHGALNWIILELTREENDDDNILLGTLHILSEVCCSKILPTPERRKLDNDFVEHLMIELALKRVENLDEEVFDAALKAMFCVNMQFADLVENKVISFIARERQTMLLGNSIVMLLNRKVDKFCVVPILKFLTDLFRSHSTSSFFYPSDLNVLITVVMREIDDLADGDETRVLYLEVLYHLLKNCPDYARDQYKKTEIKEQISQLLEKYSSGPTFNIAEKIFFDVPFMTE